MRRSKLYRSLVGLVLAGLVTGTWPLWGFSAPAGSRQSTQADLEKLVSAVVAESRKNNPVLPPDAQTLVVQIGGEMWQVDARTYRVVEHQLLAQPGSKGSAGAWTEVWSSLRGKDGRELVQGGLALWHQTPAGWRLVATNEGGGYNGEKLRAAALPAAVAQKLSLEVSGRTTQSLPARPSVRPKGAAPRLLRAKFHTKVLEKKYPGGIQLTPMETVRFRVIAEPGPLTIQIHQKVTTGNVVGYDGHERFEIRHSTRTQEHTITWRQNPDFAGVGDSAESITVTDQYGRSSKPITQRAHYDD